MEEQEIVGRQVVEIHLGQEHELVGEQDITDPSLIMHSAYQFALSSLCGILNNSDRYWNDKASRKDTPYKLYGYCNNTIAFNAHRGQGKTSAMLSFANALDNTSANSYNKRHFKNPNMLKTDALKNRHFVIMPPIDPTTLSKGERIVNLFLSWLLDEIDRIWKGASNPSVQVSEHEKNQILKCVIDCKKYLSLEISAKRTGVDDWEELDVLEDSFRIKENLCTIIQHYFKLRQWSCNDGVLIILVDDTDMQLNNAYQILEDLRKYLTLPNTVILMATYLWQLRVIVAQQFASEMGTAITYQYTDKNKISRIAAKYIDKLFPAMNIVHLPTLKLRREHERTYLRIVHNETEKSEEEELEPLILRMIFEKTGLAFTPHKSFMHYILPSTLRGLVHLFHLINEMDEIPIKNPSYDKQTLRFYAKSSLSERLSYVTKRLKNLELFEQYFMEDWCPSRISDDKRELINRIDDDVLPRRVELALTQVEELIGPGKQKIDIANTARSLFDLSVTLKKEKAGNSVIQQIETLLCALDAYVHDDKKTAVELALKVYNNSPNGIIELDGAELKSKPVRNSESTVLLAAATLVSSISKEMLQYFEDTALNSFPRNYEGLIRRIAVYEQICSNEEEHRFIFALRTYFSIQFNKQMLNTTIRSYNAILSERTSIVGGIDVNTLVEYYGSVFESTPNESSWGTLLEEISSSNTEELRETSVAKVPLLIGRIANTLVTLIQMKGIRSAETNYIFAYLEFIQYILCNWDILYFLCDKFTVKEELPSDDNPSGKSRSYLTYLIQWLSTKDETKCAMDRIIPGIANGDDENKAKAINAFVSIIVPEPIKPEQDLNDPKTDASVDKSRAGNEFVEPNTER